MASLVGRRCGDFFILLGLLAISGGPSCAKPAPAKRTVAIGDFPSPEAAVAYLFFGVEHGADAMLDAGPSSCWRLAKSSPAILRTRGTRILVRRTGECVFTLAQRYPQGDQIARIDLARVTGWRADGNDARFEGDGVCVEGGGYQCPLQKFAFQVQHISEERHQRTYEALRPQVCPR